MTLRFVSQDPSGSRSSIWADSVFRALFDLELDACPDEVADLYGEVEGGVVTLDSLQSPSCGVWLAYENSCYSKSSYLDVAISWNDATARLARERLWLLALTPVCTFSIVGTQRSRSTALANSISSVQPKPAQSVDTFLQLSWNHISRREHSVTYHYYYDASWAALR